MSSLHSASKRPWVSRFRKAAQLLVGTMGVLLLCLPLFSQGNFGRILGAVTDQSGGVISGATVTVVDNERGVARTLTTDEAGEYNAPTLIPGTYTVRVEAKGFQKLEPRERCAGSWSRKCELTLPFSPVRKRRPSPSPKRYRWWRPPTPPWAARSTTRKLTICP